MHHHGKVSIVGCHGRGGVGNTYYTETSGKLSALLFRLPVWPISVRTVSHWKFINVHIRGPSLRLLHLDLSNLGGGLQRF